jgi:predicted Zn-dependent peptidase
MLNRTQPPPFVNRTELNLLQPETHRLRNGIELFFISGGDQDIIRIEFILPAGKWHEAIPGSSYFTSTLLQKGTESKSSFQISEYFELYGVHIEVTPGLDFVSVALYGLTHTIKHTLDLFIEILSRPSFPEQELKQAREIYLQNLKVNREKTSYLASAAFRKKLFGDVHPYGSEPSDEQIQLVTRKNLLDFHQSHFAALKVFVAGKVDQELKILISDKISLLNQKNSATLNSISVNTSTQKVFHEDKEGSVQTSIRLGKCVINRHHPDFSKLLLVNHFLGGFFGSRLMKNLREEKGLTYGIHSSVHTLQQAAYFIIGTDVNKENRNLAIDEIKTELKKLRTSLVPADELELCKNHFIGSFLSELSTPLAHSDKIKTIELYRLPFTFYNQLIQQINGITSRDIMDTAAQYLNEEDLLTVSVG